MEPPSAELKFLQCYECDFVTLNKDQLEIHVKEVHLPTNANNSNFDSPISGDIYTCLKCDFVTLDDFFWMTI